MSTFATPAARTDAARTLQLVRSLTRAFGRPLRHLRRHWPKVLFGLLLLPVNAAITLWMPRLLGDMLDSLPTGGTSEALASTCWLLLLLAVTPALAANLRRLGLGWTGQQDAAADRDSNPAPTLQLNRAAPPPVSHYGP